MNIIGALKKSNSKATVYFCDYNNEKIKWEQIIVFLQDYNVMQDLNEEEIYCIAIESCDNLKTDKKLVGMTFYNGRDYVNFVSKDYYDLDLYLKELSGGNK